MTKKRCLSCNGTGRMMGGGMMATDCSQCKEGYNEITEEDKIICTSKKIDKRSKEFKAAMKRMKTSNPDIEIDTLEKALVAEFGG